MQENKPSTFSPRCSASWLAPRWRRRPSSTSRTPRTATSACTRCGPTARCSPASASRPAPMVMPMSVSPDKRFLVAAVRSKPFSAHTYSIDRGTGALKPVGSGPLAESFPYITFTTAPGATCSARPTAAHLVSVNPVNADGTRRRADAGDPDRAQRARDHHRQDQPLRVRAAPRHRPGVPVPVRREERPAHREHAAGAAAQGRHRPAPPDHLARQPLRVSPERADGHGHHARADENGSAEGSRAPPRRCRPTASSARACRARSRGAT